jgi:hypothetical protein
MLVQGNRRRLLVRWWLFERWCCTVEWRTRPSSLPGLGVPSKGGLLMRQASKHRRRRLRMGMESDVRAVWHSMRMWSCGLFRAMPDGSLSSVHASKLSPPWPWRFIGSIGCASGADPGKTAAQGRHRLPNTSPTTAHSPNHSPSLPEATEASSAPPTHHLAASLVRIPPRNHVSQDTGYGSHLPHGIPSFLFVFSPPVQPERATQANSNSTQSRYDSSLSLEKHPSGPDPAT